MTLALFLSLNLNETIFALSLFAYGANATVFMQLANNDAGAKEFVTKIYEDYEDANNNKGLYYAKLAALLGKGDSAEHVKSKYHPCSVGI